MEGDVLNERMIIRVYAHIHSGYSCFAGFL